MKYRKESAVRSFVLQILFILPTLDGLKHLLSTSGQISTANVQD